MTQRADGRLHWLMYAMGGGMGHVTRATALSRALLQSSSADPRQCETRVTLLTNSSFATGLNIESELGPRAEVLRVDSSLDRHATVAEVQRVFGSESADAVVVDTFPRGLAGELAQILPGLNCRKILVHRDLNPKYCQQYRLAEFVENYDQLIVPGEAAPFENLPNAISTQPWLVRNEDELLTPDEARFRLAVTGSRLPVAVVLGCGRLDEINQMYGWATRLADEFPAALEVRFVVMQKPHPDVTHESTARNFKVISIWPFFQAIRGANIVISGGGYNSVNEAKAAGVRFCGIPRRRLYDRQENRLSSADCVQRFDELRERVEDVVLDFRTQPSINPVSYCNGVHQAVKAIQAGCA